MIVIPGWMAILIGCILIVLIIAFCTNIYFNINIDKSNDVISKINGELIDNINEFTNYSDEQIKILSEEIKLLDSLIDKSNNVVDIHSKEIETLSERIDALKSLIDMDHESIKNLSDRTIISLDEDELEKLRWRRSQS